MEKRQLWKSPLLRAALGCGRALEALGKGLAGKCSAGLVLQGLKALSSSCSWAGLDSADLNKTLKCLELEPVLDLVS